MFLLRGREGLQTAIKIMQASKRAVKYYRHRATTRDLNKWHSLAESMIQSVVCRGQTVAELGCGSGEFLKRLAARYEVKAVGYDISETNIERLRREGLDGEVVDFADGALPVEDEVFDLVVSCEVIEHLVNPRGFLREIHRCLKRGGYFCLTTPNAFNALRRLSFLLGYHRDPLMDPSRSEFAEHIRAFSFGMVARLLRVQGFTVVGSIGDRVPVAQAPGLSLLRSLLSSEMCFLSQREQ